MPEKSVGNCVHFFGHLGLWKDVLGKNLIYSMDFHSFVVAMNALRHKRSCYEIQYYRMNNININIAERGNRLESTLSAHMQESSYK